MIDFEFKETMEELIIEFRLILDNSLWELNQYKSRLLVEM